jgi:hypothetical protein
MNKIEFGKKSWRGDKSNWIYRNSKMHLSKESLLLKEKTNLYWI